MTLGVVTGLRVDGKEEVVTGTWTSGRAAVLGATSMGSIHGREDQETETATTETAAQAKVTGQPVTVETAGTDSDETAGAEETRTATEEIHQIGIGVTLTVVMGAVGATAEVATEAETAAENAEVATRWVGTAISAAGVAAEAEALGGIVILGGTSMKDQVNSETETIVV